MMMSINEPGTDDFFSAVDDTTVLRTREILSDLLNSIANHQQIGVMQHPEVILRSVLEDRPFFEEQRRFCHDTATSSWRG